MNYGFVEILQLVGALGVFLFGMKQMSDALTELAGERMRTILARIISNRFKAVLTGFLITSVIQSSSATTLMVVSFANASLLTLTEAVGVIMGANIGTTITAWLITLLGFKVSMTTLALPLVGLGVALTFSKRKSLRQWGGFVVGFGLLFVGLEFLKEYLPDIQGNPEILAFLQRYTEHGYGSVLLFMLVGTLLTVLLQSSSATIALTLLMSANGWIPFEAAAAMVLGENIGTTITANLAAIMGNFRAKQTALAHLIFNFLGVVWMLIAFYPFLKGVVWLAARLGSPSPYLQAAAVPVAISLFHTCFNLVNTLVMIWFVRPISWMVSKIVPEKAPPERPIEEPKFLRKEALAYPETAVAVVEQESCYLFEHTILEIVAHALSLHRHDIFSELKPKKVVRKSREDLQADVRELYLTKVKGIYSEIIAFAVHAQSDLPLSEVQHHRLMEIKLANRRMVVIITDANELNRNVSRYLRSTHKVMLSEYDALRKKIVQALRIIRGFISEEDPTVYEEHLRDLSRQTEESIQAGNLRIDQLIREQQITPEMASSLLNDHDNLYGMIENLILVTELLYKAEGEPNANHLEIAGVSNAIPA